jgi:hypothetical protein
VVEFRTLDEFAHATFKWSVVSFHIPPTDPSHHLRFIAIIEDRFAHLLQLRNSQFIALVSVLFDHVQVPSAIFLLDVHQIKAT